MKNGIDKVFSFLHNGFIDMKITIYTINNCNFCKQEKEYLTSNKLAFEEKNLEINREFLAEMLKLSNNFAGVPFTMVEKDNGEVVPLKGFTKEEFDVVLGFAAPVVEPNLVVPSIAEVPVVEVPPVPVVTPVDVVVPEIDSTTQPVVPPMVETPVAEVPKVEKFIPTMGIPEIKPLEQVPVSSAVEIPVVPPVAEPVPSIVVPPLVETPVVPTAPVADPNEELKKVIDSLGAMTSGQKPANPVGTPSIPDFPANK